MEQIRNKALEHDTPMILMHIAPETPAADQKIPLFLCRRQFRFLEHKKLHTFGGFMV